MSRVFDEEANMARIAFLGLGAMGRRMARRLVDGGHDVVVWSRSGVPSESASLVARAAPSPRRAVEGAEIALSMVTDDAASASVWEDAEHGALRALSPRAIAVECSTVSPRRVTELARRVAEVGATFLDAPVVGSRPAAESGALAFLVGGPAEGVERARPVFASMGSAVHHLGPSPAGAVAKLLANTLLGVQVTALAELISTARGLGVDVPRTFDAVGSLPVMSPAMKGALASMLAEQFDPMFPIALVAKDFDYAVGLAGDSYERTMPLVSTCRSVFRDARKEGLGDINITGLIKTYKNRISP